MWGEGIVGCLRKTPSKQSLGGTGRGRSREGARIDAGPTSQPDAPRTDLGSQIDLEKPSGKKKKQTREVKGEENQRGPANQTFLIKCPQALSWEEYAGEKKREYGSSKRKRPRKLPLKIKESY